MPANWQPPAEGPRIYGLRMRAPLTLGHVLLLDEIESPVTRGGHLLPGDVAIAAFICSQPADKARRQLRHRSTRWAMKLWGMLCARWDHAKQADDFATWFCDSAKSPEYWVKSSGKECAAPWWINRLSLAMGTLGMGYDEALSAPAKIVAQLLMAYAESRGEVELVSKRDIEFREMVKRAEAARRN